MSLADSLTTNPLIEQIDTVIRILQNNPDGLTLDEIFRHLSKEKIDIKHPVLLALLNKLIKDEYAVYEALFRSIEPVEGYKLTFDGFLFARQGAYYSVWWKENRDWEMARNLEKKNDALQKSQSEMLKVQAGIMQKQADIMNEQTSVQKSVKFLTIWIAVGTLIAAAYYIIQIYHDITK